MRLTKYVLLACIAGVASLSHLNAAEAKKSEKSAPVQKLTVKELLQDSLAFDGKKVTLEGFVTEQCARKGCWAKLHDADPDLKGIVRLFQDEDASTFKPWLAEIQGKTILATGKIETTRIDADYLDKWEKKANAEKSTAKEADKQAQFEKAKTAEIKQIADLRERVAKSSKGYLTTVSMSVTSWEPKPEKP